MIVTGQNAKFVSDSSRLQRETTSPKGCGCQSARHRHTADAKIGQ